MLAAQRHRDILRRLEDRGTVRVIDLAPELGVTEETIRRDLAKLHDEGQLLRTHGGAVIPDSRREEIPFEVRQVENLPAKQAIARAALEFIEEDAVVALDASTTALELARVLPSIRLTVITNSLVAARLLATQRNIRVLMTGGEVRPSAWSLNGPAAISTLETYNITHAFISCRGIDFDRGMSEATEPDADFKRYLLQQAEACYVLADQSKFGLRSAVFFGQVGAATGIVSNAGPKIGAQVQAAGAVFKTSMNKPATVGQVKAE